jgi:hypothetical protein
MMLIGIMLIGITHAGEVRVTLENDLMNGNDRHYTHGTEIAYTPKLGRTWYVGQLIYTPSDISVSEVQREDRLYGGWLYFGHTWLKRDYDWLHYYGGNVGVLGPISGAECVQKWVHEQVGNQEPMGWEHQLKNQFAYQLEYTLLYELDPPDPNGFDVAVLPRLGAEFGSVFGGFSVGSILQAGYGLPKYYSEPTVHPSIVRKGLSAYAFVELEGRFAGHNVFLEGNKNTHFVNKHPLVGDVRAGVAIGYKYVAVSFTHVHRTLEFKGQDHPNEYNGLSVSTSW